MVKKVILGLVIVLCVFSSGNTQTVYEWYQDGIIVLQFKPDRVPDLPMIDNREIDFKSTSFVSSFLNEFGITRMYFMHPEVKDDNLKNNVQLEFDEMWKIDELIKEIQRFDFIEYAEKKELHVHFFTPNDTYYSTNYMWGLFKINAGQAWDISQGSASIVVAVTDNAIWTSHPDLQNKLVAGWDPTSNDNDPNPTAGNNGAHGTHVSGTVGAQTNNGLGVASIGFNVSVMPIKIGRDSDGALTHGYEGMTWAADNGADVVNMSWGGGGYSTYGQNVCTYVWNAGTIPVAAAGNNNVSTVFYPAGYDNVISVASTAQQDQKSSFSQYGTWIDISAPGTEIASTVPTTYASSGYAIMSGTSMASPHVAGLLGLMKSANPSMSNTDLIDCLYSSADDISAQNPGYPNQLGAGRINAYAALQCVTASATQYDAGIQQIISPTGASCNTTINPVVVLRNYGTDNLTSVTINYQIVGQTVQTQSWTGNLAQGATANVTLPAMTSPSGVQVFRAYTTNPNGQTDQNLFNDESTMNFGVFSAGVSLPFYENFESATFATNMWTIENPDGATTWEIATTQGTTPGNKSAGINFYSYATIGQRDGLISPPFDFSGFASVEMTFEHAYRRYDQTSSDSLIIYVSTDCGVTYQRIFARGENGTGIFATAATNTANFIPAADTDWCIAGTVGTSCYTINLDAFAGFNTVVIKFEGYNNYQNNLYLDNINIYGDVVDYDIGISDIVYPEGTICNTLISPEVTLHNFGATTITSAQIHYQLNGGTVNNYSWTGSITSGNSVSVILPQITAIAGQNTLYVYSSQPNGFADANPSNDASYGEFTVIDQGAALPFVETFESGVFSTNEWIIDDPDQVLTWDIYDVQGTTPGNKAAGINYFFYSQIGERDGMITKYLDFSNHTNIWLDFEHAYRRRNAASSDSLIIYVSADCGNTWTRVFQAGENGTGVFATDYTSTVNFIPQQPEQWCHSGTVGASCYSLDLTPWAGQPLVQVKFESYNNNGNNLFIDNINIDGDIVTAVSNQELNPAVQIYPNPASDDYVNLSLNGNFGSDINVNIYNIIGVKIHSEHITSGTQLHRLNIKGFANGTYIIEIKSTLFSDTRKLIISR